MAGSDASGYIPEHGRRYQQEYQDDPAVPVSVRPCPPWCARHECDGTHHESARTPIGEGEMFAALEPDPVTGEWTTTLRTDGEITFRPADVATFRALADAYLTAA